jgi:hypothetical protein
MATNRQVLDGIRDAPEFVTSLELKQHKPRLLANGPAPKERMNSRFQQAFTGLMATLISILIT